LGKYKFLFVFVKWILTYWWNSVSVNRIEWSHFLLCEHTRQCERYSVYDVKLNNLNINFSILNFFKYYFMKKVGNFGDERVIFFQCMSTTILWSQGSLLDSPKGTIRRKNFELSRTKVGLSRIEFHQVELNWAPAERDSRFESNGNQMEWVNSSFPHSFYWWWVNPDGMVSSLNAPQTWPIGMLNWWELPTDELNYTDIISTWFMVVH
jgi:hypothetical protein